MLGDASLNLCVQVRMFMGSLDSFVVVVVFVLGVGTAYAVREVVVLCISRMHMDVV